MVMVSLGLRRSLSQRPDGRRRGGASKVPTKNLHSRNFIVEQGSEVLILHGQGLDKVVLCLNLF